jgi:hypothetical protein
MHIYHTPSRSSTTSHRSTLHPPQLTVSISSLSSSQLTSSQRAFRQRKEGHIKKLEEQVRDYSIMTESYKRLQAENYQLRDYIISLQSRLIESHGEFPQPPSNIDLHAPRHTDHQQQNQASAVAATNAPAPTAPTAPMAASAASQLQASAAQAVAAEGQQRAELSDRTTDPTLAADRMDGLHKAEYGA